MLIYVLTEPLSGEIRYVGWTATSLEIRLARHLRDARHGSDHRRTWLRSLQRRGLTPTIDAIQSVPFSCWAEAERYWIRHFRERGCPLTNGTDGGEGTPGQTHTAEARARMSKAHRERPRGPRGPMSDAQKTKLRAATAVQMADPAMRAAVSAVHAGKTLGKEQREAVSRATTLRWAQWRAGRFPQDLVTRYEAGETLTSLADACSVSRPAMRRALLDRGATLRGRWGHPLPTVQP